ncbi:MAG TPA: MFS transporter [Gammaproteobacteria bacterium]|nr:MFS transporter [Gammaproteobacteria bacterium]
MKNNTKKLIIISGIVGNFLEQYDIMICAFLAQTISLTFFPAASADKNLFNTFYIFLAGYLARPLGSLLIGLYADQSGRKKALIFSIVAIGIGTTVIGLIPSYKDLGILSTGFFILFRILQNLSAGGEYISSLVYLTESAGKTKRGFYGSWVAFGVNSGTLIASLIVFVILYYIDMKIIPGWSWRLIFLTAILGMGIGLWIRCALPESIEFILEHSSLKQSSKMEILKNSFQLFRVSPYHCLSIFAITWLGVSATIGFFVYIPIHLSTVNHISKYFSYGINTVSLFILIIFIPVFGVISDYFNRVNMLIAATISLLILSLPAFWYFTYGNPMIVLFFKTLISIPLACYFCIAPVIISETFPLKIRCTSIALIYQISASLSAGLTPIIMLYLAHISVAYSPGYFLTVSSIAGLMAVFFIKKSPLLYGDFNSLSNILEFLPQRAEI